MGEGRGRGRVGQVVCRHVDSLYGGDRALAGGSDTLLQSAHLGGQRGLVADGGGHTAQQSRDLRTGLGETEDVINEEQHVLMLDVTEILRHRQAGQGYTHTGSWRLVHLAVDQRCFA